MERLRDLTVFLDDDGPRGIRKLVLANPAPVCPELFEALSVEMIPCKDRLPIHAFAFYIETWLAAEANGALNPTPYTLHHTPFTLHPARIAETDLWWCPYPRISHFG